jgi:hypothetical protein
LNIVSRVFPSLETAAGKEKSEREAFLSVGRGLQVTQ